MKTWIISGYEIVNFGYELEKVNNYDVLEFYTDYEKLNNKLHVSMNKLIENQCEIKSVVPLTTSRGVLIIQGGEGGAGGGYGFSQIVGYTIFYEKKETISDEEYDKRCNSCNIQNLEINIKRLNENFEKIQIELAKYEGNNLEIIQDKIFMGPIQYIFMNKRYKSEDEAIQEKNKILSEIEKLKMEKGRIEENIKARLTEIETLKARYQKS